MHSGRYVQAHLRLLLPDKNNSAKQHLDSASATAGLGTSLGIRVGGASSTLALPAGRPRAQNTEDIGHNSVSDAARDDAVQLPCIASVHLQDAASKAAANHTCSQASAQWGCLNASVPLSEQLRKAGGACAAVLGISALVFVNGVPCTSPARGPLVRC